jgi:lipid A 3-O-deacylase
MQLPTTVIAADAEQGAAVDVADGTWRLEFDNDAFFNSDNKFTSGIAVQRHSNLATTWNDVRMPAWTKFGQRLPGLHRAGTYRRMGVSIGQNLQTPDDLEATELIVDDVPYAGALGAELNWIAFDNDVFQGYGLLIGILGPLAGGKPLQKLFHELNGSAEARGWDNQLANEIVVNFNGMYKRKIGELGDPEAWSADLAVDADFGVGTALVFAEAALELRAGFNVPRGFAFAPDPTGRTLAYDAVLWRPVTQGVSVHVSAVARAVWMPHFVFLDGSLFREGHSIDKEDSLSQVITGLHVGWRRWGVHFSSWRSSANVRSPAPDPSNHFGTIAIDWTFTLPR